MLLRWVQQFQKFSKWMDAQDDSTQVIISVFLAIGIVFIVVLLMPIVGVFVSQWWHFWDQFYS